MPITMETPSKKSTWMSLIRPNKLEIVYLDSLLRSGTVVISPLERGFGMTLGNALRRVLLSQIAGSAISSIKIDGVAHEFSAIPGVREDVQDIILNLKTLRIKLHGDRSRKLHVSVKGPRIITAKDLNCPTDVEVMDPEHVICEIAVGGSLNMELTVSSGKGYVPASQQDASDKTIGLIFVDAIYSPVTLAVFDVEQTRVGQRTDYDKLTLTVHTDGSIRPDMAVEEACTILRDHFATFVDFEETTPLDLPENKDVLPFNKNLLKRVDELELSVRAANCLKNENIFYIGDLVQRSESDMLKTPNFGRKSLNEIKGLLRAMGFEFGMVVPSWPPENIDELSRKHDDQF
ncbi:MAG: DNA-directed RNA polymerase subunit alpha [Holosporales bacterium]|jgi:DNA-directed RNA polymerase subunit alpha|nr:DNA-directed RNA polymerase subunit alpha [Holosporales bacterium]